MFVPESSDVPQSAAVARVERSVLRDAITICICTRNRPEEVVRCLASIATSTIAPVAIVLSDDGTDDRTRRLIVERFPEVLYLRGPKRGIAANRNNAARAVLTDRMMFLDDDDRLAANFLAKIDRYLLESDNPAKLIVTGVEMLAGELVVPSDFTFLGYQQRPYTSTTGLRTYVNTCAVLPTSIFDHIAFDEKFVYGSEDNDFSLRATTHGYRIDLLLDAVNIHESSNVNRDFNWTYKDASRIYFTLKRYFRIEHRPLHGVAYAFIGPLHLILSRFKAHGFKALPSAISIVVRGFGYFLGTIGSREK